MHNPKQKSTGDRYLGLSGQAKQSKNKGIRTFWSGNSLLVIAGSVQILAGLAIVGVTILGLLNPLWLAAMMSLVGSISSMFGVYLIFYAIASGNSFDTLINQSIKRVIRDQN